MSCFRLYALLGIVLGGAGCGLPDSYYLLPPVVVQASLLSPGFQITGTDRGSDTGANFLGYELYYKFYGSTSDPTFISESTSFGTGSTYIDLQQAGFHRLCLAIGTPVSGLVADTSAGYASAPLINISEIDSTNINKNYTIMIRLNDLSPLSPAPTPSGPPPNNAPLSYYVYVPPVPPGTGIATTYEEVRRFVTLPSGSGCKTFAPNSNNLTQISNNYEIFNWTDADLLGSAGTAIWGQVTATSPGYIYVMMYALSYGKSTAVVDSTQINTPIYSSPVSLGFIRALVYP